MHYTQFTHILLCCFYSAITIEDDIEEDPNWLNVCIDDATANGGQKLIMSTSSFETLQGNFLT